MIPQNPRISQAPSYRIPAIQAHSHPISAASSGSLSWGGSAVLPPGGLWFLLLDFSSVLLLSMNETVCSGLSQASFNLAF